MKVGFEETKNKRSLHLEIRELKSKDKEIHWRKEEHKNLLNKYGQKTKLLKATKDDKEKQLDIKRSENLELQNTW